MKKSLNKVIGITLAFIMVFLIAPTSVFAYDDISSFEIEQSQLVKTRNNILSQVREQLIEQGAIDHYHLYEKMIDTQLGINNEEITISSGSSVRLPNGGAVYYSNYLNTGTEV
ncbi:hypothetical protein Amet_4680 [Alkaliphilus metalliredigens QYMF]|uniref:Uncharacterized protein n=1 Tax=Alkaliphilus metalliredigens (strain QYMF) TaxID=293826 RepID=A6TX30_ALKMQ|nr:hypothetical protein [Alkaliphilus metalliredigens]ABR50748.1 hypothetical protein Amet_4680 [Alkaliphilus metalliredigens QYMF]